MRCPFNMEYQECGSACEDTCSNLERSQFCIEQCKDGCFCPPGTVFDDVTSSGCIPREQCSCTSGDKVYSPGSSLISTCQSCNCTGGQWNCDNFPCPGTCAVEGASHFVTYDKTRYDFNGNCVYILSKLCQRSTFIVEADLRTSETANSETVLKLVHLHFEGKSIVFHQSGSVTINLMSVTQFPFSAGSVHIFKPSTSSIVLHTPIGLHMQIQLSPIMRLYITLDPAYKGETCGLCGNYNDEQTDDFKSSSGVVEGTATSFANTWKTISDCPNVQSGFKDPCSLNTGVEQYAQHFCSLLKELQGPFGSCHSVVNPKPYYKNCKYDTCSCTDSEGCMCATFASYVRACASKGVLLSGWRATVCSSLTTCPDSLTYSDHISTCQLSCRSLSEPDASCSINFVPVDGCVCENGTYMNDAGKCVPPSDCPCYYKGNAMPPGEATLENGVSCTCTLGKIDCFVTETSSDCTAPMFYFNCTNAPIGSTGAECMKSCQHFDIPCTSIQCISGCVCPEGMAYDGKGGCVKQDECPCLRNGIMYQQGEKVNISCSTCTCTNGEWSCTEKETLGTCALYGEGHYITFDSKRYIFNGNCEYTLAQDYCGSAATGTFQVVTENIPCGTVGTTCSKAIKVFVGDCILILSEGHYKEVGCGIAQIPYVVRQSGIFLVVEVNIGLILVWDKKTRITVKLIKDYKGKICGLCGTYDGDGNNDFNTRGQVLVGSAIEFGNSWKFSPKCPDAKVITDLCSVNPKRKPLALKDCRIITSDVFASCHAQVDAIPYYEACLSDTCACNTGGDCDCFCTAVAAYAQACSEACICVHWRTPDLCPLFCDYYNQHESCEWHYKPCGAPCMKTCRNPSGKCLHDLLGLEGCYPTCSKDQPYLEENSMECVNQCGCYDEDGNYYKQGAKIESCESCQTCKCTMKGIACTYDIEACVCNFEGKIYRYKDVIYQTTDGLGRCINNTCGTNGTITRIPYDCPTLTRTTTLPSSTTAESSTVISTGTAGTLCVHVYKDCVWSEWVDLTNPDTGPGDFETLDNLRVKRIAVCKAPSSVQCRAEKYPDRPITELGQNVICDKTSGLVCKNADQNGSLCLNYQVRFLCCSYERCDAIPLLTFCMGPNGEPKKFGDSWISNCNTCTCEKDNTVQCTDIICEKHTELTCEEGFEIVELLTPDDCCCPKRECRCNPSSCSNTIQNCTVGFQLSVVFGACCINFTCVPKKGVCVVDNTEYLPGSIVPFRGPCSVCHCMAEPESEQNTIECVSRSCIMCPEGQVNARNTGECCGSCVPIACVTQNEDGTQEIHQPGDTWVPAGQNCSSYRCSEINGQFIVATEKKICPDFVPEDCEPDTIQLAPDGCCWTCTVKPKTACLLLQTKVPVSLNKCSGYARVGSCIGGCPSSVTYSVDGMNVDRQCTCCKETSLSQKTAILSCSNGNEMSYVYTSIASCDCLPC